MEGLNQQKYEGGPKHERWEDLERLVDRIFDRLGLGIDPEIKPLIVSLKANGFGTTASCAGHLERGTPFPWADVESEYAEGLQFSARYRELKKRIREGRADPSAVSAAERIEYQGLIEPVRALNIVAYERLRALLDEFYGDEEPDDWARIGIEVWSPAHRNRILPARVGLDESETEAPNDERARRLAAYRTEMARFAAFLKDRFFSE